MARSLQTESPAIPILSNAQQLMVAPRTAGLEKTSLWWSILVTLAKSPLKLDGFGNFAADHNLRMDSRQTQIMSDVPLEGNLEKKRKHCWICHISNTTVIPTQDGHTLLNAYVSYYGRRRRRRQKRQTYSKSHSSVSCRCLVTRYHVSLTCHSTMIQYPCFMLFLGSFLRSILLLAEYHMV